MELFLFYKNINNEVKRLTSMFSHFTINILCICTFFSTFYSITCQSEPVTESDKIPLDLRRTTLIVKNIENSLSFYRDALGMKVAYDKLILTPRTAGTSEQADHASRLVLLRANDNFIGMLGLLEYIKPRKAIQNTFKKPFSQGSSVLLFNTDNLSYVFSKAKLVKGVEILQQPSLTKYPSYKSDDFIRVNVSVLRDPDGFIIEVNQLLDKLKL